METNLPIYTQNQKVGNQSADLLVAILEGMCVINTIEQAKDLGIDFTGVVLENSRPTPLCFNGQSKGTEEIEKKELSGSEEFAYSVSVSTVNYWKQKSDVTFLFLVDSEKQKAYWVDAMEYLEGIDLSGQKNITFRIPKNQYFTYGMKTIPEAFKLAIMRYQCGSPFPRVSQLETIKTCEYPQIQELLALYKELQKNAEMVENEMRRRIVKNIIDQIMKSYDKIVYYVTKLDQMDDIVRVYCPDGVFNDRHLGYDNKSMSEVINELVMLRNLNYEDIDGVEALYYQARKVEKLKGNVLGFYREMAYEDCPMGDHSEIEKDFKEYMENKRNW